MIGAGPQDKFLTYINKKINTNFISSTSPANPSYGVAIDNVVTLRKR